MMPILTDKIQRAPAFFVGHGTPMNAIANNAFTKVLHHLGETIEKPKAILIISAHWMTSYSAMSIHNNSDLIYDMYGFPNDLYQVKYAPPNASFLAPELQKIILTLHIEERNLDHGTWSILVHLFPNADIPVMQLSINSTLSMQEHFEIGRKIRTLREKGVMIIGSGNITHNLRELSSQENAGAFSWAQEFDTFVKNAIIQKDYDALIHFENKQRYAKQAHPTTEHYIPLLYIAGSAYTDDGSKFIYKDIAYGSLSMRSWLLE